MQRLQFATGVTLQDARRFWLAQTSLPLPSEEPAEFVFLGTTTSISLFYSLILIQSGKTWIVFVFLVYALLHSFASRTPTPVIPSTHVAGSVVGIS